MEECKSSSGLLFHWAGRCQEDHTIWLSQLPGKKQALWLPAVDCIAVILTGDSLFWFLFFFLFFIRIVARVLHPNGPSTLFTWLWVTDVDFKTVSREKYLRTEVIFLHLTVVAQKRATWSCCFSSLASLKWGLWFFKTYTNSKWETQQAKNKKINKNQRIEEIRF